MEERLQTSMISEYTDKLYSLNQKTSTYQTRRKKKQNESSKAPPGKSLKKEKTNLIKTNHADIKTKQNINTHHTFTNIKYLIFSNWNN